MIVAWLCLSAAMAVFAFSLLAVFRAPSLPLVFLAVGATELGHWFAIPAAVLAVLAPGDSGVGIAASIVAGGAALLLISPALRARREGRFRWRESFRLSLDHDAAGERLVIDGPGGPLGIDFHPAAASAGTPAPLVVIAHGGGWMAGNSRELSAWNLWLAERGYAVASVDYRLVPTGAWPAQRDDVLAAIDHLRANAARYGLDAERVVLLGRSAGGQIAGAIAATGGRPWLRGCVCLYAPFDLNFAYEHGSDDDVLRSRWLLRCYLGGTPEQEPAHYREASPYLTVHAQSPPFLLLHGRRDELVWCVQSRRFASRLAELGGRHTFIELPWATHAFDFNLHGPGGQVLTAALESFLARVCDRVGV